MKYFHIKTNEWIDDKELQKRLDNKFDFCCNDCNNSIGEHIKVVAEGIFCNRCGIKIIRKLMSMGGSPVF